MSDDVEQDADGVNPVRRDKLTCLGDKLDAAEKANSEDWPNLFLEYRECATEHALNARLPKIRMTTYPDRRRAREALDVARQHFDLLKADLEFAADDDRSMRAAADLHALVAVAERNMEYIREKFAAREEKAFGRHTQKLHRQKVALNIGRAIQQEIKRRAAS
jgi:hypothetical protein